MSSKKKSPEALVTIPFGNLVLAHTEIGVHRGRTHGFGAVFGFRALQGIAFTRLAKRVKAAYEGTDVPRHKGWSAQRDTLKWFVDQGAEALYQLKDDICVYKDADELYAVAEGNHRSLALYILGADSIRAAIVKRKPAYSWARPSFGGRILKPFR